MDVDCSNVDLGKNSTAMNTTTIPEESLGPDSNTTIIDEAVEFVEGKNITDLTANDTLKDSGLTKLDINTTSEAELKQEFCREVSQIARRFEASPINYSMTLLVEYLVWVDLDLGCSTILLGQ